MASYSITSSPTSIPPDFRRLIDELIKNRKISSSNFANSTPNDELNSEKLKELKSILRKDERLLRPFYEYLLDTYLCKDNLTSRLHAVLLIDEIFRRSHAFRECVIGDLEELLNYTLETDALHYPLPSPKSLAKNLKERTLKIVHDWCNTYGTAYRKLQTAYDYLKGCKTFDFQRIEAETVAERERADRERRRAEQIRAKVFKKVKDEYREVDEDIRKTLLEINSGFRLLIPELSIDSDQTIDQSPADQPGDQSSDLQAHGITSRQRDLSIEIRIDHRPQLSIDRDNIDLINQVIDAYKLIDNRYLPLIRRLLAALTKHGGSGRAIGGSSDREGIDRSIDQDIDDQGDRLIKRLIDVRMQLDEAKRKFQDLNIDRSLWKSVDQPSTSKKSIDRASTSKKSIIGGDKDEDDDEFEVVPEKEGLERFVREPSPDLPDHLREWSRSEVQKSIIGRGSRDQGSSTIPKYTDDINGSSTSKSYDHRGLIRKSIHDRSEDTATSIDRSIKTIPYGIDLEYWDQSKVIKPSHAQSNADCHRFWRPNEDLHGDRSEGSTEIEAAAYRTRVIEFAGQFEPIERECRASLDSMGDRLCTRRDRERCPFHGRIVERDERGRIVVDGSDQEPSTSGIEHREKPPTNVLGSPDLLEDIERATGQRLTTNKSKKNRSIDQDVAEESRSTRDRLERKIFNRSAMKRVAAVQKSLDDARQKKKFAGQWQYVWRDQ